MDLPDIELHESVTGERILPGEPHHEPGEVPGSLALTNAADLIRTTIEARGREIHGPDFQGLWPSEALKVAEALAKAGLLSTRQHDAEVAATAHATRTARQVASDV